MAETEGFAFRLPIDEIKITAVIFLTTLLVMKLVEMMKKKRYNLPPGPWGLPLVGYLPFFGPEPHVTFTEMRKKYGDVISISMGSWPTVVINGSDVIQEALVTKKDDFAGRPAFTISRLFNNGKNFIFLTFGDLWKMQRRVISNVIYTFSNARKNPVEDIIRSDAKTVIQDFMSQGENSFCPLDSLGVAGSSIMYQLCYGRHQNIRENGDFIEDLKQTRIFSDCIRAGSPINVIPWLRHLMPGKMSTFLQLSRNLAAVRSKRLEEHEASFDESSLRDITDGLIHVGNQLTEEEKAAGLDRQQVLGSLGPIFGAGTSTVASTLKWFVGLMAAFPELQEEIFQQINTVVGQSRDVTLADRAQLPLVEATVYEVLRYVSIVPLAVPHITTRDTTLRGYDIPEGTVVMVNLYSVCMDDKLWGDPTVFRPQRFLDSEGRLDRAVVERAPVFSLGRRRCVGEFLARMELFLFTATLLQHLKFFKPPGTTNLKLKAHVAVSLDVEPFDICVSQRD